MIILHLVKIKEKWYDRTLVFKADKIPVDCLEDGVLTDVSSLNLEDGKYTADVSMTGGSGRAEISTPVADNSYRWKSCCHN